MKTKTKAAFILSLLLITIGLIFVGVSLAAEEGLGEVPAQTALTLQVPILGYTQSTGIAEYIYNIYVAALYILVPIAIVIVIFAGASWVTAGGDQSRIKQAKQYISSAFWGLTLGLLSYVILSLVGLGTLKGITPEYIDNVQPEWVYINGKGMTPEESQKQLPEDQRWNVDEDNNPLFEDEPVGPDVLYNNDFYDKDNNNGQATFPFIKTANAADDDNPCLTARATPKGKCGDTKKTKGGCCRRKSKTDCTNNLCVKGYCGEPYENDEDVICVVPGKTTNPKPNEKPPKDEDGKKDNGQTKIQIDFTNYYKPTPYDTDKGDAIDFWCNAALNCWCPNNNRKNKKYQCTGPVKYPCDWFSKEVYDAQLCALSSGNTKPTANTTLAADPNTFKVGCKLKILDRNSKKPIDHIFIVEDTGTSIKGNRMDLFLGTTRNNPYDIHNTMTIVIDNEASCLK